MYFFIKGLAMRRFVSSACHAAGSRSNVVGPDCHAANLRFHAAASRKLTRPKNASIRRVRKLARHTKAAIQQRYSLLPGTSLGQASVEAAILLPSLLFVIGMMTQPACIFYTRSVMAAAAAEGARVVSTQSSRTSAEEIESFVRRRLRAIPNLSIFHEGGEEGWEINVDTNESEKISSVEVKGKFKPLPLLGLFSAALVGPGKTEGELVVKAEESLRPEWLSGDYESWVSVWGE